MSDSVLESIRTAIRSAIVDADVQVSGGGGGHFTIAVASSAFGGKSMMESHRLVYAAIAPLMQAGVNGEGAPVHAVDSLKTTAR